MARKHIIKQDGTLNLDTIAGFVERMDGHDISIASKANATDVTANASAIASKANATDVVANTNAIATKADKVYVDTQIQAVGSGSPKGVYATLSALQTAFPTGTTGIYVVSADGKWYYWSGSAWTPGGTYQSTAIAPLTVTPDKADLQMKQYPFRSDVTLPNIEIMHAVKELKLFNADPAKQYTIAVLQRNVSNLWSIRIYEWTNGAFGTMVCWFNQTGYTETSSVDLVAQNSSGITGYAIIDWSQLSANANYTNMGYTQAGVHAMTYIRTAITADRLQANIVDATKLSNDIMLKNYPFVPTSLPVNTKVRKAILDIKLYGAPFSKQYTFAVVQRNVAGLWSLKIYEWVGGTFGTLAVCQFSQNSYTPSSNVEKINLTAVSGSGISADVIVDWSQLVDGDSFTSMTYAQAGIAPSTYTSVVVLPSIPQQLPVNALDNIPVLNKTEVAVVSQNNTLDTGNSWVSGIALRFLNSLNKAFNSFSFQGHTFTNANAKYAFIVIRTSAGTEETHIKPFSSGALYDFMLSRTFNLTEGVVIVYGYCDANFNTISPGVVLNWASSTVTDTNVMDASVNVLNAGVTPIWGSYALASSVWKTANYSLNNVTRLVYDLAIANSQVQPPTPANQYDIVLPPKLYLLNNSNYWYYEDAIILNTQIYEKAPCKLGVSATKVSDGSTLTTNNLPGYGYLTGGADNYNLNMQILDYSNSDVSSVPVQKLSKTFGCYVKPNPTGKNPGVLMIGDSYLDLQWGSGILEYIKQFATTDGNTITYKGTRTSYGDLGEARASWAESTFYSRYVPTAQRIAVNGDPTSANMTSPFVFSSDDTVANAHFDFAQYLSVNSITGIDTIVFFLGMNGGDGSNMNSMITNIQAALPNVKILVCMIPGAERSMMGQDSVTKQLGRLAQNTSYLTKFQNREASNVYLIPTHMNFNRTYSIINTQQQQVQFNLDSVPTQTIVNDHHPTASGAKGIAYMIYQYLMYVNS